MTKVADLPTFDMAEHLKTPEDMAAYLSLVVKEGDAAELARAQAIIERTKGMSDSE